MTDDIDISKMDKPRVLAALYNSAKPQGLGHLHFTPTDMTAEEAATLISESSYFDYVHGRVMKVDLGGESLRTGLYDRDNGDGAAHRALSRAGLIP